MLSASVSDWTHVSKVHWDLWCHYLGIHCFSPEKNVPLLLHSSLRNTRTVLHIETLHLWAYMWYIFVFKIHPDQWTWRKEGTIWVTLRVTWFQAKVSEKNMQKPLTFQLLLVGTHFTKGIWQLFKIIKKKNKPQKRPKTRISERYLCMLSLVVGSFLYTQLDTLRMIRIPMVTTSTCVLHPFHWGIKTLQVSHSGRFPRMMLSDYHASF